MPAPYALRGFFAPLSRGAPTLDDAGVYEARCLIPGHADAGMVMEIVVE